MRVVNQLVTDVKQEGRVLTHVKQEARVPVTDVNLNLNVLPVPHVLMTTFRRHQGVVRNVV